MTVFHRTYTLILTLVALFVPMGLAHATTVLDDMALNAGFVPHRALYTISLHETKSDSQLVNVSGQMLYEWHPSCDGWLSNHRFNIMYEYADSPAVAVSSDFLNYESFDGARLDFTSQKKRQNNVVDDIRGYATIAHSAEEKGVASYTKPSGLTYNLPQGSVFPIGHSLKVLEAIRAKKRFFASTVFDGSDEDGPVSVNAFIGKPAQKTSAQHSESKTIDAALLQSPAHKIRLAFFPLSSEEEQADYEMDLVFHENSVISDITIEYKDFAVKQSLLALEKMDGKCEE